MLGAIFAAVLLSLCFALGSQAERQRVKEMALKCEQEGGRIIMPSTLEPICLKPAPGKSRK